MRVRHFVALIATAIVCSSGWIYAQGRQATLKADDLVTLVRIGARELPRVDPWRRPLAPLRSAFTRIPRNTRAASREHIAAHYDLGNDMFRLFLDDSMTYSCAYFESPGLTLGEAQEAKLDRVCRKLELTPDDHVVEIGTGWGSFALHAAGRYGCRVTTTTISPSRIGCAVSPASIRLRMVESACSRNESFAPRVAVSFASP